MVGTLGHPVHATATGGATPDRPALTAGVIAHVPAVHMAVEDAYPKAPAQSILEDGMTILSSCR